MAGRINKVRQEQGLSLIDATGAQTYIEGFSANYPKVREFFETEWRRLQAMPQKETVVRSLMGMIRKFDTRANPAVERKFRGTVPQQIEADLIKTAIVRLHGLFKRWRMGARMGTMFHDSLWAKAPEEEAAQVKHLVRRMIETPGNPYLNVPVEADFA